MLEYYCDVKNLLIHSGPLTFVCVRLAPSLCLRSHADVRQLCFYFLTFSTRAAKG